MSDNRPTDVQNSFRAAKRNVLVTLLGRAASISLNFVAVVWIINYLGDDGYGPFVMVFSVVTLMDLAGEMSIFQIAVREISKSRSQAADWFGATTSLRLVIGAIGGLLLLAAPALLNLDPSSTSLVHAGTALFLISSLKTPITYFRANLVVHWELAPWILSRAIDLGLIVWITRINGNATHLMIAKAVAAALHVSILWVLLRSLYQVPMRIGRNLWGLLIRYSIPVGATAVLMLIQLKGDILICGALLSSSAVGAYGAVTQVPEFLLVATSVMTITIGPILAQCVGLQDVRRFQSIFQRVFDLLITVLPPCCMLACLFAGPIIATVFGSEFVGVVAEFRIVVWVGGMIPMAALVGCAAVALNLQRRLVVVETTNVIIYVLANVGLLMVFRDTIVSAWIRLLVVCIGPTWTYAIVRSQSHYRLSFRALIPSAVATGIGFGVAAPLATTHIWLAVATSIPTMAVAGWMVNWISGRWHVGTESAGHRQPEPQASGHTDIETRSHGEQCD